MLRIISPRKLVYLSLMRSLPFTVDTAVFNLDEKPEQRNKEQESKTINKDFLKNIVCPLTKKPLRYDSQRRLLINDELAIGYKVENGIPNLIPTEAIKLDKS